MSVRPADKLKTRNEFSQSDTLDLDKGDQNECDPKE